MMISSPRVMSAIDCRLGLTGQDLARNTPPADKGTDIEPGIYLSGP